MVYTARSRSFVLKAYLRIVVAIAFASLILLAQPAFGQRGGGRAGGFGGQGAVHAGGRTGGGGSRGGGGGRSYGGFRGSGEARVVHGSVRGEPAGGMTVVSGAPARGDATMRSFGRYGGEYSGASGGWPSGLSEFAEPSRFGAGAQALYRGATSFAGTAAPRHVTIGFPPDRENPWRQAASIRKGDGPIAIAGEGSSMWLASPRRTAAQPANRPQARSNRPAGMWQPPEAQQAGQFGRGDLFFHRGFRRHYLFGSGFGYPFGGYGLGLWSDCDQWLDPNWESDEDSGDCYASPESEETLIGSYGADPDYAEPRADTQQEYGPYAWQNPPTVARYGSSASIESEPASGFSRAASKRGTLIYLRDGTNYESADYWLAGDQLHYVTSYGAEDSIPINQVDLQRTVDANAARGVPFTLRPAQP